jgi:ribosome-associated protein
MELALEAADVAKKAVEAALDKQAADILMVDIRQLSSIADYFVVCSAESDRQIRAICDEIEHSLKKEGVKPHHREGSEDSGWVLLDFSGVIVHVFSAPQREFYEIEKVWSEASPVVRII